MRQVRDRITVGPPSQPDVDLLLGPPAADPGVIDVDTAFAQVADHVEVVQEPTDQPWGTRDCAFRDPAGNLSRIQEFR